MRLFEKILKAILLICGIIFSGSSLHAQLISPGLLSNGKNVNNIYTAVPFLLITPDARSGGMGEAGAAISPDANAAYWNPAKLAFVEKPASFSVSYTPWLRKLVPDINLSYLSFYQRLDNQNVIGFSLRYFSLGQIELTDLNENTYGSYRPGEFAIDGIYARKLSEQFSLGVAFRYINSNLNSGMNIDSYQSKPVSTVSGDASAYYNKKTQIFGTDGELALGLHISNLGNKVTYQVNNLKYYLPANVKLGIATTLYNNQDKFTLAMDLNKLMVPTNPERDLAGRIIRGKETDRTLLSGIFGSFADAPGGFAEELREISYAFGTEYWIRDQFALRAGYFFEDPTKGNRHYATSGIGIKYKERINLDLAYIIANAQTTPMAQTIRFTLMFNMAGKKRVVSPEDEMKKKYNQPSLEKPPAGALQQPVRKEGEAEQAEEVTGDKGKAAEQLGKSDDLQRKTIAQKSGVIEQKGKVVKPAQPLRKPVQQNRKSTGQIKTRTNQFNKLLEQQRTNDIQSQKKGAGNE